jgi:hypothetical protein
LRVYGLIRMQAWLVRLRRRMRLLVGTCVLSAAVLYALSSSRDDLKRLEERVRADYRAHKGIILTKVGFVRKNAHELHGFAAFQIGLADVVKACIATREYSNSDFAYNCY